MANNNNYFSTMISKYNGNTNFIVFQKPEQIQMSAKTRIFREIVRGQIDFAQYGQYFLDSKFLENLIIAANDLYTEYCTIYTALNFYDINMPGNIDVDRARTKYGFLIQIFQVLLSKFGEVKITGNIGILTDIKYILKDYAKYI